MRLIEGARISADADDKSRHDKAARGIPSSQLYAARAKSLLAYLVVYSSAEDDDMETKYFEL